MNRDEFIQEIGTALRLIREQKKLSQEELAKLCGLTQNSLSHYENGNRSMNVIQLHKLSQVLGISAKDLVPANPDAEDSASLKLLENPKMSNLVREARSLEASDPDSELDERELYEILYKGLCAYITILRDEKTHSGKESLDELLNGFPSTGSQSENFLLRRLLKLILTV